MTYFGKIKTYGMMLSFGLLGILSCTDINPVDVDDLAQQELLNRDSKKWADEKKALEKNKADSAAIAEKNKEVYEIYLADLREYKKSKHLLMFGWFAYWNPTSPDKTFYLDLLPDSVDFVSNWGASWNLDEIRKQELENLHKKGTRMTIGFIIEHVGSGLKNQPEGGWSTEPYEAIDQYAKALCDSIEKYNYDGIDVDYEPSFQSPWKINNSEAHGGNTNHCGDFWDRPWGEHRPLISCGKTTNKQYENYFFRKLRELLPEEKMLNINGSIDWLDPQVADVFNYFVFQSYGRSTKRWTSTASALMSAQPKVTADQFIYTESFQGNESNAKSFVDHYANFAVNNADKFVGGIGAFHINEDYLYGPNYKNVKAAISVMNPPFDK